MKLFIFLLFSTVLIGCAATPRDANIRAIAIKTFGSDINLILHEITFLRPALDFDDVRLRSDVQLGRKYDIDLVIYGRSSTMTLNFAKDVFLPGAHFPHLRLLFVGDAKDAEIIRPKVEATGAQFYFHQQVY